MMSSLALQKAHLADIEPDVHGRISKKTAQLDGISVTEVTFGVGARWSEDLKSFGHGVLPAPARLGGDQRDAARGRRRRVARGVLGG